MIEERAHAKVNLVLRVGPPRADGLHSLCSLFASLELAEVVRVDYREGLAPMAVEVDTALPGIGVGRPAGAFAPPLFDEVVCPGVRGDNLAGAALTAFRDAAPAPLAPLRVEIEKRVPVAAGLGGGSADAAAVLRGANALAGSPLSAGELRAVAAGIGSDVPSQVEPRHALVSGAGERVEPLDLPAMTLVLVPQRDGLSTAAVYAELDRLRAEGERARSAPAGQATAAAGRVAVGAAARGGANGAGLDPDDLRAIARMPLAELAQSLANELEPAALSLRPRLREPIEALRAMGALAAQVTGSGPTVFGVFADRHAADRAAATLAAERTSRHAPAPIVTELRR